MKMVNKSCYINFCPASLGQAQAIFEINPGPSHQLAGYQVIIVQDANIKMRKFHQNGVPPLFERGIQKFCCVNPVATKNVELEIFSISFPPRAGCSFLA